MTVHIMNESNCLLFSRHLCITSQFFLVSWLFNLGFKQKISLQNTPNRTPKEEKLISFLNKKHKKYID